MIPIKLQREDKLQMVSDIQQYLEDESAEKIGNIVAEGLLDLIIQQISPYIYNQAIDDARKTAIQQMEKMDEELSVLEKPLSRRR